jgi:two-component system sensor histidine kinase DegS
MTANLLLEAETLVEQFCRQLDGLLQQARERQQALESEARQLHRFLDEVGVRLSLAGRGESPFLNAERLRAEEKEARQRQQSLLAALAEAEESARRLELLRRQVEMSGRSLRQAGPHPYDPWELALRSQVLYGREQERQALAREVHDGPAQVLSNAVMGLERCRQAETLEEGRTAAEDLLRDLRLGLQEVRRFIYDLRPSPLAEEPLGRQIERYIRDLETAYSLTIEFRWGAPAQDWTPEEKVAIYRIVQEALQNARRHARAEKISVEAYVEPDAWVIQVVDDGVGFDPTYPWHREDHWGLQGMQERARLIGAELQVESRPGEGTTVRLRLPLPPTGHR